MGTMSASGAAPLPRLGEVFFDVRGDSRTMRVSWYADTGVAVFSIWQGDTCTGTFRLPIPELPRMVEALAQGPPGRAGSGSRTGAPGLGQADAGTSTAAMRPSGVPVPLPGQPADDYPPPYRDHEETPLDRGRTNPLSAGSPGFAPGGGYQDPRTGPDQDLPPRRGYGGPRAGYAATTPTGYQEGPPAARYTDPGPGGYQGPPPGGQHQMPADGYYQEPAPQGHHDLPPGGYYQGSAPESHRDLPPADHARPAAGGYQDAGYQVAPPGGYEGPGSVAPAGYQGLPPRGYRDLPPAGGYGDVPPGADCHIPQDGYREPPAAPPPGGPAPFAGRQQDSYPPTGPLPVGRWRTGAPGDEIPQARREDGFAPDGFAPDGFAEGRTPADTLAADEFAPEGYAGEPGGYGGDGFAQDEFTGEGFPHDPLADSYQGEAEQGYLPSPPTDIFPAASLSGGYPGQGSHPAGYEPDPAAFDHENPYPDGRADRGGPPRDSGAYRPGRGGAREREYGHSRGRS